MAFARAQIDTVERGVDIGVGALLGREIDRGDSRALGTIVGAGAGALVGRSIDRGELRCR